MVCGVNNDHTQRRLLAEPELTFGKALQLAGAIETEDQDAKDLASFWDCQTIQRMFQRRHSQKQRIIHA